MQVNESKQSGCEIILRILNLFVCAQTSTDKVFLHNEGVTKLA